MDRLCGLYARVSTERQSDVRDGSLDTQTDRLKQYIEFRRSSNKKSADSWKIVDIYREEGKSGKNIERPELQRLISDIKAGLVNTIVCTKIDRITRSTIDFAGLSELFEEYNTEFISLEENFDTSTPIGEAVLNIIVALAQAERKQTAKRTSDKMRWRAEQGLWNGGQVLGYDLVDKRLVINKKEAQLVKLMFKKYLELGSVLKVVEYLNSHGYKTKEYVSNRKKIKRGGKRYFNANVLQKLTSVLYIGKVTHKDEAFPGQHEAIISKDLWEEVNKLIDMHAPKRVNPKREAKHTFLLQGLLKCGWCNSYMSTKYSSGRNGLHYYYQCTRNSHGGKDACNMKYVPAPELEKTVLKKLKEMSGDKELIKNIIKEANKNTESTLKELKKQRRIQDNELKPIKDSIKNLVHAISQGNGLDKSKSILEELNESETQKDQKEKDINTIEFEINQVKQQILSAKVMHESLTKFSQIYEVATPL